MLVATAGMKTPEMTVYLTEEARACVSITIPVVLRAVLIVTAIQTPHRTLRLVKMFSPTTMPNRAPGHPAIPKNSCNVDGDENFAGSALGLDNDGDGVYDTADSDCSVMADTYTVGGNVNGLTGSGLALQNNGGDTLAVAANGSFTFATELQDGSDYSVTVSTQPTDQTCSVANGSGTIAAANVTNIAVTCADSPPPGFQINAGLNDAWYNPLTDGQGFFVTVYPDRQLVFLSWFTYDTTLPPEDATSNLGDPAIAG